MNMIVNEGLICVKNELNIEFTICKLEYTLYEDETFKYVFTPYYDVIDLLDSKLFQGIPGINLDLRKSEYIRENILPVFISERVPSPNREDYYELLEAVNMTFMDPIEYLVRTDLQYFGDDLYLKKYKDKEEITIEDNIGKANSLGTIKIILDNIARGNIIKINNQKIINKKEVFDTLLFIYRKGYKDNVKKQREGIEKTKEKYKGRKPIKVDKLRFLELLERVNKREISPKEAANKLNISIDKYYRYKKELQNENDTILK